MSDVLQQSVDLKQKYFYRNHSQGVGAGMPPLVPPALPFIIAVYESIKRIQNIRVNSQPEAFMSITVFNNK